MRVLVTGFTPFGGETLNPAYEAVKMLPEIIAGADLIRMEIPTVFGKAGDVLEEGIQKYSPDIVVCVGQAGGASSIMVEKVAINYVYARIPDNEGHQPQDQSIRADGPAAYFASVPVTAMVSAVKALGIPAAVSYSAGTFVCNDIFYSLMYLIERNYPQMKGGFIHVPYFPEQTAQKSGQVPSMAMEITAEGLCAAVEAAVKLCADANG